MSGLVEPPAVLAADPASVYFMCLLIFRPLLRAPRTGRRMPQYMLVLELVMHIARGAWSAFAVRGTPQMRVGTRSKLAMSLPVSYRMVA